MPWVGSFSAASGFEHPPALAAAANVRAPKKICARVLPEGIATSVGLVIDTAPQKGHAGSVERK